MSSIKRVQQNFLFSSSHKQPAHNNRKELSIEFLKGLGVERTTSEEADHNTTEKSRSRSEYMSWRLWKYQQLNNQQQQQQQQQQHEHEHEHKHKHHDQQYSNQQQHYNQQLPVKRSIKVTPQQMSAAAAVATTIHDTYSHEVPQTGQKCYQSTTHQHHAQPYFTSNDANVSLVNSTRTENLARTSCSSHTNSKDVKNVQAVKDIKEEDEYDDEDDYLSDDDDYYYLSEYDDEENYDDDVDYHFIQDFKKTKPRPVTTPRRSLLSDLLQKSSAPPSLLLSNSTCSITSSSNCNTGNSSSTEEDHVDNAITASNNSVTNKYYTAKILPCQLTTNHTTTTTILNPTNRALHFNNFHHYSDIKWRESFHGW